MKLFCLTLSLLALSACTSVVEKRTSPLTVRSDVLYLPDTPSGHESASRLRNLYRFEQTVVFMNFDMPHLQHPDTLQTVPPFYPSELRDKGIEGAVTIVAIVDEHGHVTEAAVKDSTNKLFEAPAIAALKQWKFRPSKYFGVPIRAVSYFPMIFHLR